MRGKEAFLSSKWKPSGITPAYAGKSEALASNPDAQEDHPRLCGEKVHFNIVKVEVQGSPPPMRGKGTLSGFLFL